MGMTRAWGSEEMEEEKSEKMKSSFRDLVEEWVGPDLIWDTVNDWIEDYNSHAGKSTVGNFVNYCFRFTENVDDHYELRLWLLNLVAHFMAKEENWLDNADDSKHWDELFLCEKDWEVPPPLWTISRENENEVYRSWVEEEKTKIRKEEKDNGNAEESLDNTAASPLDQDWGKDLPAPTPAVAAPSTPVWRPWEENSSVVNLSAVQKRKRRSPAAAACSRRRLQIWQEKKDMARLMPEPRTTPNRILKQIWSTNLLRRLEECANDREGSKVQALREGEMESSVLFCNHSQTIMQPQINPSSTITKLPVLATPSPTLWPQPVSPVQQIVTICPTCRIWNMSSTS